MRIGYLGPFGSHSHLAADRFQELFLSNQNGNVMLAPMLTLTQVLQAVEEGSLDVGCVPVENAIEGAVTEVLDTMAQKLNKTIIQAEFIRPVQHALIRRFEFTEGIEMIHSHPQAFAQCRERLYELLGPDIKFIPASSTSEAVKSLLHLDESHAAIGTAKAAEHYGLDVVMKNLADQDQNQTRFIVVTANRELQVLDGAASNYPVKTSYCFGLHENKPGALLMMLNLLALYGLNLSKIESRPTKNCLGKYLFYIDVEGRVSPDVENIMAENTSFFKCLGVYPILGILE